MILFDTNVIIDMANSPDAPGWTVFQEKGGCICGITITELYRGLKSNREKAKIERLLSGFTQLSIEHSDWKEAGLFIAELRNNGLTIPFQDALIAYLAIKSSVPVLTSDKHFKLIKACDERLQLL